MPLLAVALLLASALSRADISYVYDELGRLKSVTDASGETAEYVYDSVGNLTRIRRTASGVPAVTEFTPDAGPVGTVVTIRGANFGATPGANTVRFNGVAASINSAEPDRLEAVVPPAASTGPITVQTAAGTGASASSFTVGGSAPLGPPTITGFTPTFGVPGTPVTIAGTNFDPTPGLTRVYINSTLAQVTGVDPSGFITVLVPPATGSGKIRVATSAGTIVSEDDFIIPAYPYGDILGFVRIAVGGEGQGFDLANDELPQHTRWVMFLFDGKGGDWLTVDLTTYSGMDTDWLLHDPRNQKIDDGPLSSLFRSIHVPPVRREGTYTLYLPVEPLQTLEVEASLKANAMLLLEAPPLPESPYTDYATIFPGQSVRYTFPAVAGQGYSVALQDLTGAPTAQLRGFSPTGAQLPTTPGSSCTASADCDLSIGPVAGTGVHGVTVTPAQQASGSSGKVWASADQLVPVQIGSSVPVAAGRPGQNARFVFEGSEGQHLGLAFTGVDISEGSNATARVLKPDGSFLTATTPPLVDGNDRLDVPALPQSGPYTVFVDPSEAGTFALTLSLSADQTGQLELGGASHLVDLGTIGQTTRLTFVGAPNDDLGLGLTGLVLTPGTSAETKLKVFKPDSNPLASGSANCLTASPGGGCEVDLTKLPDAGTYVVEVAHPLVATSASGAVTLSRDEPGALALSQGLNVSLPRAGQNAMLTFSVDTTGLNWRLQVSNLVTDPLDQELYIRVWDPSGGLVKNCANVGNGGICDLPSLTQTGPYRVRLSPNFAATASMTVTLTNY